MKKPGNILVITYWPYNSAILKSYALPYLKFIQANLRPGGKIYLFTLTPQSKTSSAETLKVKEKFSAQGIELVNYTYSPFGPGMVLKFIYIFISLIYLCFRHKIDVLHGWCTPGGAIAYVVSLFAGRPLVIDSFEPHAESMVETKTWKKNSFAFKILFMLEKRQLKRADAVICAAEGMIAYSEAVYGIKKPVYYVKPACVDLELFSQRKKNAALVPGIQANDLVCVYIGKFGDIYLLQEVFDFFKVAATYWGSRFKVLLLTNHSDEEVKTLCQKSGLNHDVIIKGFVDHDQVPDYLALGDFGICPVKPVPTKKFCTPIKNAEYWAMGLPVVITKNISTDSQLIADHNIGYVLQELNTVEYLNAVKKIDELLHSENLGQKIRQLAVDNRSYTIAEKIYRSIYS